MCAQKQNKPRTGPSTDTVLRCLRRIGRWFRGPTDDDEPTATCVRVLCAAHDETERLETTTHIMCPSSKPRVEAMLALISYCYAKGLLGSAEIEQRLWRDRTFLASFGDFPSAQQLRVFRRRHRQNILAIIEQALQESRLHASSPNSPTSPLAAEPVVEPTRRKAEQLLDMANVMDRLATD